jgi:hypothetical protein
MGWRADCAQRFVADAVRRTETNKLHRRLAGRRTMKYLPKNTTARAGKLFILVDFDLQAPANQRVPNPLPLKIE